MIPQSPAARFAALTALMEPCVDEDGQKHPPLITPEQAMAILELPQKNPPEERAIMPKWNEPYEKGTCIWVDTMWFVVVKEHGDDLDCICDGANNIYSWKKGEATSRIPPMKVVEIVEHESWPIGTPKDAILRGIPLDVMVEVLTGMHDDRFSSFHRT